MPRPGVFAGNKTDVFCSVRFKPLPAGSKQLSLSSPEERLGFAAVQIAQSQQAFAPAGTKQPAIFHTAFLSQPGAVTAGKVLFGFLPGHAPAFHLG
jgi:hypothetical protein